ncbi:MAG: HAD-IC family P-type ATPase, partial [Legionella sp.]|nr:HAD-IC family P-type ATPase [Legionella sp.]
ITQHTPNMEGDKWTHCDNSTNAFKLLLLSANLCSDATFYVRYDADILKWVAKGDASESAIVKFVQGYQDLDAFRAANRRKVGIPFNSINKYMVSINSIGDASAGEHLLTIKGAPERIFDRSKFVIDEQGKKVAMDAEHRKKFEGLNETLGKRGERVIAFAELALPAAEYGADYEFDAESDIPNFPMDGLTLIGLISMIDPPRDTVRSAIVDCHTAGVQVFMVTGDHPITALAISKSLGLVTQPTAEELKAEGKEVPENYYGAIAVHGTDLAKFTQEQWDNVLKHKEIVFARTQPQQKQDIVRQLTALGHICAMTGDGVNDAPALKAAHVGVAMGSGAQVAKEAAQIVLLKDDFSNIVDGIREGRTIFDNMKKTVFYIMISNIPELIPFLAFIIFKIPLAISTIVILVVALGTDILPCISLAYEEPEETIMLRKPRGPDAHLASGRDIVAFDLVLGMLLAYAEMFAFCFSFDADGFTVDTLRGAGPEYSLPESEISGDQKLFFQNWCAGNKKFIDAGGNSTDFSSCSDYRATALNRAQASAFLAVIYGQIASLIARLSSKGTSFTWFRLTHNNWLFYAIIFEIALALIIVLVPKLNSLGFGMEPPD